MTDTPSENFTTDNAAHDFRDAAGNLNFRQRFATAERIRPYGRKAFGKRNLLQRGTFAERGIANGRNALRDNDALETFATAQSRRRNLSDIARHNITFARFPYRIANQFRFGLAEKNAVLSSIKSDPVILNAISRIIGVVFNTNQYLTSSIEENRYTDDEKIPKA